MRAPDAHDKYQGLRHVPLNCSQSSFLQGWWWWWWLGGCVPANLSSEWVRTQSCFCFWGLLSRGRTIPPCPLLLYFSFFSFLSLRCSEHTSSLWNTGGVLFDLLITLFGHDCGTVRERKCVCIRACVHPHVVVHVRVCPRTYVHAGKHWWCFML